MKDSAGIWVKTSERLPNNKKYKHCENEKGNKFSAQYLRQKQLSIDIEDYDDGSDYPDTEHFENDDTHYLKEGWYETIEQHSGSYDEIIVSRDVYKWLDQSLPSPVEKDYNVIDKMINQITVQIQQQKLGTAREFYDIKTLEGCLLMLEDNKSQSLPVDSKDMSNKTKNINTSSSHVENINISSLPGNVDDKTVKHPIRLKHFNISNENWLSIRNNTVNNNEIIADTLYQDESEIKGDFFHSESTAKNIGLKRATDLALSLLRTGVKISFLDDSKKHILKISPPLYNKYFKSLPKTEKESNISNVDEAANELYPDMLNESWAYARDIFKEGAQWYLNRTEK